jgi:hypothetical protein
VALQTMSARLTMIAVCLVIGVILVCSIVPTSAQEPDFHPMVSYALTCSSLSIQISETRGSYVIIAIQNVTKGNQQIVLKDIDTLGEALNTTLNFPVQPATDMLHVMVSTRISIVVPLLDIQKKCGDTGSNGNLPQGPSGNVENQPQNCPGSPPSRMSVGIRGRVTITGLSLQAAR